MRKRKLLFRRTCFLLFLIRKGKLLFGVRKCNFCSDLTSRTRNWIIGSQNRASNIPFSRARRFSKSRLHAILKLKSCHHASKNGQSRHHANRRGAHLRPVNFNRKFQTKHLLFTALREKCPNVIFSGPYFLVFRLKKLHIWTLYAVQTEV